MIIGGTIVTYRDVLIWVIQGLTIGLVIGFTPLIALIITSWFR